MRASVIYPRVCLPLIYQFVTDDESNNVQRAKTRRGLLQCCTPRYMYNTASRHMEVSPGLGRSTPLVTQVAMLTFACFRSPTSFRLRQARHGGAHLAAHRSGSPASPSPAYRGQAAALYQLRLPSVNGAEARPTTGLPGKIPEFSIVDPPNNLIKKGLG